MTISDRTLSVTSGASQAGVSLYLIGRAVITLDGFAAVRTCILGLILVVGLMSLLVSRARQRASHSLRDQIFENDIAGLRHEQRQHHHRIDALRNDVDRKVMETEVQAIAAGIDRRRGRRHLMLAPEE